VLHAEVGPAVTGQSSLSVAREFSDTPLFLRHVVTLQDALGAWGTKWDPQVEVVP
jgi:hypothetical protein